MECKRFNLSICLIIKDEGEYLEEWLDWHIKQGISHFYIYDNKSNPPIKNFIPSKFLKMCTIINFNGNYCRTQIAAYNHCLLNFSKETEWIAFIDTDEFIRPITYHNILEFLETIPEDADAILLKWIVYGADGKVKKEDLPVRERFHSIVQYPTYYPSCKVIAKTDKIIKMDVHMPMESIDGNIIIVNEKGNRINGVFDPNITHNDIVIDHYFTRSLEEWIEKIKRGTVDEICQRQYDLFFELNTDMSKCYGGD